METLEINKPCPLNYSKMDKTTGGRHCSTCNKVVVDFRGKSPEEISKYFRERPSEDLCGKFSREQVSVNSRLDKWIIRQKAKKNKFPLTFLCLLLISWLLSLSSCMGKAASNVSVYNNNTNKDSTTVQIKK